MTEKTRLEKDLEMVQLKKGGWGGVIVLLLFLLIALFYIGSLHHRLYEARRTVTSLNLEVDTLLLKLESLGADAARCSDDSPGKKPKKEGR